MDPDLGVQAISWTGITGLIAYVAKKIIVDALKGRSEVLVISANDNLTAKHMAEITRLEGIIIKLQADLDSSESRCKIASDNNRSNNFDIIEVVTLVESLDCCKSCTNQVIMDKINKLVKLLRDRRS